jgi:transcriptional regulator with XRE-family HTH domain
MPTMARPPRLENVNNPLRQLRTLLNDPAKRGNFSQKSLAELCQIPIDTIKSIEAGRLALSSDVQRKIAEETGAHWHPKKARWTRFDRTEFSFSSFWDYHREKLKRPIVAEALVDLIHSRIDWLFKSVRDEDWQRLRSRVNHFLEECKRDPRLTLRLTANEALFYHPFGSEDSAANQVVKPEQQKRRRASTARGPRGNVAGNKKRKRKYGL